MHGGCGKKHTVTNGKKKIGKKTNHSLRVAGNPSLYKAGVPEKVIQNRTGHRCYFPAIQYNNCTVNVFSGQPLHLQLLYVPLFALPKPYFPSPSPSYGPYPYPP